MQPFQQTNIVLAPAQNRETATCTTLVCMDRISLCLCGQPFCINRKKKRAFVRILSVKSAAGKCCTNCKSSVSYFSLHEKKRETVSGDRHPSHPCIHLQLTLMWMKCHPKDPETGLRDDPLPPPQIGTQVESACKMAQSAMQLTVMQFTHVV